MNGADPTGLSCDRRGSSLYFNVQPTKLIKLLFFMPRFPRGLKKFYLNTPCEIL
jgi:hypothetical protein